MASVESIGSCSLDVDATASESSGTADGRASSISQHTLQSASIDLASGSGSLSLQGAVLDMGPSPRSHSKITTTAEITGAVPTTSVPEIRYVSELYIPNGQIHGASENDSELIDQRKPSYINISCSVSGYTSYSCYNSKVREELHSRDNSPARLAFSSETNHAQGLRSVDHLHTLDMEVTKDGNIKTSPTKKLTPTKLHTSSITLHVNSNGSDVVDRASRLSLYEEKRSSVWRTSSEDGILSQQGHTVFAKRQEVCREYKDSNGSISVQGTYHESSEIIDSNNNDHESCQNNGASLMETKSLIQQRIERLYGPGALAQGFRIHRERKDSATYEASSSSAPTPKSDSKDGPNLVSCDKVIHSTSPLKTSPISHNFAPERQLNGSPAFVKSTNSDDKLNQCKQTNGDLKFKHEYTDLISDGQLTKGPLLKNEQILSSSIRSGQWFIDTMNSEKAKIESLIAKAEQILNNEVLSEDNCGRIRAAIGKANLLLTQKFLQFKGLCEKNLTQSVDEPFPTTVEDLAGFWDMVLIQVEDIYGMFDAIERAQQNHWMFDEVDLIPATKDKAFVSAPYSINSTSLLSSGTGKGKKPVIRKAMSSFPQRSTKSEEALKAREEARRRLLEAKRKGRHQTASQVDHAGIEIFVPEDKL